jgi:hypothetical protein
MHAPCGGGMSMIIDRISCVSDAIVAIFLFDHEQGGFPSWGSLDAMNMLRCR